MSEDIFTFPNYDLAATISGLQDKHLKIINEFIPVTFVARGDTVSIKGDDQAVANFKRTLQELLFLSGLPLDSVHKVRRMWSMICIRIH